jgi:hypothetical protein
MDELVIDDKKYISTRQAAKITGYAKDYVGQLCREGRVPARLVGRSWYVLESALADHRFGNDEPEKNLEDTPIQDTRQESGKEDTVYSRYEVGQTKDLEIIPQTVQSTDTKSADQPNIQEVWEAWFERVGKTASAQQELTEVAKEVSETDVVKKEEQAVEPEGVKDLQEIEKTEARPQEIVATSENVKDSLVVQTEEASQKVISSNANSEIWKPQQKRTQHVFSPIQTASKIAVGVVTLFFTIAFAFGTGIFDRMIISAERDSFLAGVSMYKK